MCCYQLNPSKQNTLSPKIPWKEWFTTDIIGNGAFKATSTATCAARHMAARLTASCGINPRCGRCGQFEHVP